jgi:formylglycine-generating enzyme required for sulfatase activity/serine/threonine protein kinase
MSTAASLPAQFGRYRIVHKVGAGGMGAVYLAEDTLLGRRVALKVPHFNPDDGPEVIERFYREARIAAGIDHANICAVHDVGQIDGIHYLSMPFIEGTPLSRCLQADQPWPPRQAVELVRQLALALAVLHQRGLIHRDLKPGNVMLRPGGEPVLMDFGLARSFHESGQRLTATGTTMGTPSYMAPEQVIGDPKAMGPCTDVYGLGVILYELVTGSVPFTGPLAAVYSQILHGTLQPPSVRRPGLDPALDGLCVKALARKSEDRYGSMAAFAQALQDYLHRGDLAATLATTPPGPVRLEEEPTASEPAPAPPPSNSRTTPAPAGGAQQQKQLRHGPLRAAVLAAGLVLMFLVLAVLWLGFGSLRQPGQNGASKDLDAANRPELRKGALADGLHQPKDKGNNPPVVQEKVLPREITNSLGMQLVLIPKSKFKMGSPGGEENRGEDEEQHEVEITQPFYMGVYEVTQEQYEKVMGNNPSRFNKARGGGPTHPVENVSWEDAMEFCKKLSALEKEQAPKRRYGLPTEAQWEYACRGGARDSTPFHFGRSLSSTQANFNANYPYGDAPKGSYLQKTTSVGSYKPNDFGLYDMHGNVWEWCADWYDSNYYKNSPIQDPKGPENGDRRVLRGGSWYGLGHNCRAAYRGRSGPGSRGYNGGFRVVLPAAPRTP